MRPTALSLPSGLLLVCLALPLRAQTEGMPFLPTLSGARVEMRYAPGGLDRATHLQARLELLTADFASWSDRRVSLVAFVLSRQAWEDGGITAVYGLPRALGPRAIAAPAFGDRESVDLWRGLLRRDLPLLPGYPLTGTPEEAASLSLSDLLLQSETARLLLRVGEFSWDAAWVGELAAQVVAQAAFDRWEPDRRGEIEGFYGRLAEVLGGPGALPLAATFSSLPAERLWAEAQYYAAARMVLADSGTKAAKRMLRQARKAGGALREVDLLAATPGLAAWLERSFRP